MSNHQTIAVVLVSLALAVVWLLLRRNENASLKSVARISGVASFGILFVALLVYPYVLGALVVTSRSMTPTLRTGDQVFINKFIYRFRLPHYGEIVLFKAPPAAEAGSDKEEDYVKRVVGLPGDVMEAREVMNEETGYLYTMLFRNGKPVCESYLAEPMEYLLPPVKVPRDHVFVLGDNRNESFDSHVWGPLPARLLIGRATLRIRPSNRFGYVK